MNFGSHLRTWRGCERSRPVVLLSIVFYTGVICLFAKHNFRQAEETATLDDAGQEIEVAGGRERTDANMIGASQKRTEQEIVFFLILCEGEAGDGQGGKLAADISRQLRQAAVMLKSAVALATKKLRFLVIADSKKLYHKFAEIPSHWPEEYQRKITMEYRYVWYPPNRVDMRNMFRVCATERLFLPEMFPELDAAIYIDTDLIFMRPPDDLWNEFDRFNDRQVAAMAPCLYHYGSKRNKVPFYGTSGLNAGIMHLNLTRLSTFPDGGWIPANMKVFEQYKKIIKLADQDILNILFHKHPDLLFELGCQWNYRLWQCSQGTNMCPHAAKEGASALHGNAMAFVSGQEMKLQVVFEAWENHLLGSPLDDLLSTIKKNLALVSEMAKPSKCARIPEIDAILTRELSKHVSVL
ncbi:glucoside xylosyltransferase 2-like isoform X1 [Macrobrachium nipponense]|uniref:glucoside xylosyltransferase 2-like isoform X1 n=1 Tax=Macrobrachium nipponense TaxID=159736 RepID=UPI0030C80B66